MTDPAQNPSPTPSKAPPRSIGVPIDQGLHDDALAREDGLRLDWRLSPETLRQIEGIDAGIRAAHRLARTLIVD